MRNPSSVVLLAAAVFGLAACDDDGTGPIGEISTVEAWAYVDMDGDGVFTAGSDEAISGAQVTLTPSDGGAAITATTDANGIASFSEVQPGTYTAGIDTGATPADAELISAAAPTVVAPFEGATVQTEFRFAYDFDSIESVKAMEEGSAVFVSGVVTAGQGAYRTNNIYLQDATGGIQVFGLEEDLGLQAGDRVRLRGDLGSFNDEQQIVNPFDVVTIGTADMPEPVEVTPTEINALTNEGELVVTRTARVLSVGGGSGAAYNVTFFHEDDVSETFDARIEALVGETVTRDTWEIGAGYDLTGILGSFRGSAQIKPRSGDDIVRVADPIELPDPEVVTIEGARALELGTRVQVEGVVTVEPGMHRNDNLFIQDETGGIQVFGVSGSFELGQSIRVVGEMGAFNDELQIVDPVIEDLGMSTVPDPIVISATVFNSLENEGELITIENVSVVSVGDTDGSGRYNVTVTDGTTEMQVRIEGGVADTITPDVWEGGGTFNVTGVLGQYRGTAQLKPRMASDVQAN